MRARRALSLRRCRQRNSDEEPVQISGKSRLGEKKGSSFTGGGRKRPTLKELQEKKYPFPHSDLSGMLGDLLENGIIELPTPKRPEEAGKTSDPKYRRYHQVISHPLEKCITLKERIMQLTRGGRIILDLDDSVGTNHIFTGVQCSPVLQQQRPARSLEQEENSLIASQRKELFTIPFGSLEPIVVPLMV